MGHPTADDGHPSDPGIAAVRKLDSTMDSALPLTPATTSDIARAAGVSRATVSHVLNNHRGKFSAETESRVLAALEQLKYRPSMGGRALANGRSDIIIVVLPRSTVGISVQEALDLIVEEAAAIGASVLTRFATSEVSSTVNALLYIRPLAVMDLGGLSEDERDELERAGVVVVPERRDSSNEDPEVVAGRAQVDLLLPGKRRVLAATLRDLRGVSPSARGRVAGVIAGCEARGLAPPEIVEVDIDLDRAVEALGAALARGPVGIACYNDDVATVVFAAARKLGLSIPEDVAIVGMDATPLGGLLDPPLTSVRMNIAAAIRYNMDALRAAIGSGPDGGERASLPDIVSVQMGGTH